MSRASGEPDIAPTVLEGTLTHTIHTGGKWQLYFNANGAAIRAANREAIWFSKGSNVWRYNVARQAVDVEASLLSHASLGPFPKFALAEDGRLAISGKATGYLWTPGKGWSGLPQPAGDANSYNPSFDVAGTLWAVNYSQAFKWVDGTWAEARTIRQQNGVFPVADGWLMWNNFGQGNAWPTYTWFTRTFENHTKYPDSYSKYSFTGQFYRIGKDSYGVFSGVPTICRITKNTFEECIQGPDIGLDLASGEVFACVYNGQGRLTAQLPNGKPLAEISVPLPRHQDQQQIFLRDANGHFWLGHWRFDGKTWTPVTPANAFDFAGDLRDAIAAGRLRFDPVKNTWIDAWPTIPIAVQAYDPKSRTGWLQKQRMDMHAVSQWDQFAFNADGSKQQLQSVVVERVAPPTWHLSVPRFQDPNGNWWFGSCYRWDGKATHTYGDGYRRHTSDKEGIPTLVVSPRGGVWMYHTSRVSELSQILSRSSGEI